VKVWEVASGKVLLTLALRTDVGFGLSVAFSPDGMHLAAASHDGTVKVWEVASGQELHTLKGHTSEVNRVAFSPDGTQLASASVDQTVKVWKVASGQELHTLQGHVGMVHAVAFSPDGARLAAAPELQMVTLWEVASGQELRSLQGHTRNVMSVAFSPDGMRLASAGLDWMVKIWDARPLTPALKTELEARGLVEFVCDQAKTQEEASTRIRSNKMISEPVRQQALALVPTYWTGRIQAETSRLVDTLFNKPLLKEEVLATIRADGSLTEEARQRALSVAERSAENAWGFYQASRSVARQPGQAIEAYRRALRQAEIACRLDPEYGRYLTTLGVAQYRVGQYQEALDTLTRSDQHYARWIPGFPTDDLAYLAMTQHHLGQHTQAQANLARFREIVQKSQWAPMAEAQASLREAEALLHGSSKPIDP
jgi:hypothetical protein